ncbi:MAG: CcmD family protein [Ginsengibacter sp.]
MNKFFLRLVSTMISLIISIGSFAQQKVEMADAMRSNGKIYVVVAVCTTLLVGLFVYVFLLDKKISRLEKNRE